MPSFGIQEALVNVLAGPQGELISLLTEIRDEVKGLREDVKALRPTPPPPPYGAIVPEESIPPARRAATRTKKETS